MPELPARIERIVLVGLMGSGKSSVGARLARDLGWRLVDLDREIETASGQTIPEIFKSGEETFRRLEQQLTAELASTPRMVFTPGGGWITCAETVSLLPERSAVFWLRVTPEEAVRRCAGQTAQVRPLLTGADHGLARARELARDRNPRYEALGVPIDTNDRSVGEIAAEILGLIRERV